MSLILNIDTALENASVSIADKGELIEAAFNSNQSDHASWLHPAVDEILNKTGTGLQHIKAVSVSIGPGSYTGLRVGLAAAKGYCYALNIPLLAVGTLEIMARSLSSQAKGLICPLIDARRMEVYTATYTPGGNEVSAPRAMIISEDSFADELKSGPVLFCGSGTKKLQPILKNAPGASYTEIGDMAATLAVLAFHQYAAGKSADLAYTEPLYIKEFYTTSERK